MSSLRNLSTLARRPWQAAVSLLVVLSTIFGMSGCFLWPIGTQVPAEAGRAAFGGAQVAGAAWSARGGVRLPERYGTLQLQITWPKGLGRDVRGYHAQLIPDSAAAIAIKVLAGTLQVASATVNRSAGQATASVTLGIPARSNLSIRAEARNAGDTAIALGTAAGINIVPGRTTPVDLTMLSLFTPAIASFDFGAGASGDSITITGSNLRPNGVGAPVIRFNGTDGASKSAPIITSNDQTVTITIPANAAIGRVEVVADGVPSYSQALFWVVANLEAGAPKESWDTSAADRRIAVFDDTLSFSATPSWAVEPGRQPSDYGQPPLPTWSSSDASIASFEDAQAGLSKNLIVAAAAGVTNCKATLGTKASNTVVVDSRPIGLFHFVTERLPEPRFAFGVAHVKNFVYLLGGALWGVRAFDSVLRAAVAQDGSLGAFSTVQGVNLAAGVVYPQAIVVGDYLYSIGGGIAGGEEGRVQRARIDGAGNLAAFEVYSNSNLARSYPAVTRAGGYVYVIGGYTSFPPGRLAWIPTLPSTPNQVWA